jgi:NAD(P)-dependent dehydrogenase (short-subunit alcohol dehydrogenase family)
MASSGTHRLDGKVALVTGGSRGIGRAIASAYARAGARVYICGRNQDDVGTAVRELQASGGEVDGGTADVGSVEDVKRVVRSATRRFGTIDVLVNNASIVGPRMTIAEYPDPAWEEVLRINLSGVFFLCREVLPLMLAKRSGSIINVTSGVGRKGKARWGAYAVSKAGLECLTQVLADEVTDSGIRVNAVNPAATRTAMRAHAYPQEDPQTLPEPEEIVGIFLYLASEASAAVSGQSLDARDWGRARHLTRARS